MQWCVLTIIVLDSWSKTGSSLQCAFLFPLLDYNWLSYQLTCTVYYRLYTKEGPLESNHPIFSNDRFISRIASTLVRPPQTAASLTKCICKLEGLEHRTGALYQSLSENTALEDSTRLLFQGTPGPRVHLKLNRKNFWNGIINVDTSDSHDKPINGQGTMNPRHHPRWKPTSSPSHWTTLRLTHCYRFLNKQWLTLSPLPASLRRVLLPLRASRLPFLSLQSP